MLVSSASKDGDKTIRQGIVERDYSGTNTVAELSRTTRSMLIAPVRYGFRSFDRQWIIPDARLINRPNPTLWKAYSARQVYLTAPEDRTPTAGPALTFTGLIPDLHHYNGRGGRVYPLWRDRGGNGAECQSGAACASREALWAGGQRRGHDGLYRRRHGASGLHGALQGRSRPAGPAAFRSPPMRSCSPRPSRSAAR